MNAEEIVGVFSHKCLFARSTIFVWNQTLIDSEKSSFVGSMPSREIKWIYISKISMLPWTLLTSMWFVPRKGFLGWSEWMSPLRVGGGELCVFSDWKETFFGSADHVSRRWLGPLVHWLTRRWTSWWTSWWTSGWTRRWRFASFVKLGQWEFCKSKASRNGSSRVFHNQKSYQKCFQKSF